MSKVHLHPGLSAQVSMVSHLPALVIGQRKTPLRTHTLENANEAVGCARRCGSIKLHQEREQRLSLDQRADLREAKSAFD